MSAAGINANGHHYVYNGRDFLWKHLEDGDTDCSFMSDEQFAEFVAAVTSPACSRRADKEQLMGGVL